MPVTRPAPALARSATSAAGGWAKPPVTFVFADVNEPAFTSRVPALSNRRTSGTLVDTAMPFANGRSSAAAMVATWPLSRPSGRPRLRVGALGLAAVVGIAGAGGCPWLSGWA